MSIQNTPLLQTNRLTLRKFTQSDLPALLNIHSDKEVNKFLPMFPLKNLTDVKTYWENQYAAAYKQKQAYQYAICLKEDNIPIGLHKHQHERQPRLRLRPHQSILASRYCNRSRQSYP
ncbi:GNAT family N-acetyltransferase [Listeria booriae]|uniref:GNAT family N-acetyltransferase n=1 Tax=Listeria booriae TaxID=1552123 RepID=UPI001C8CED7A